MAVFAAGIATLLVAACTSAAPPATSSGTAAAQSAAPAGSKGEIRIALGSVKQVNDLPQLVAAKDLTAQGYKVSFQELQANDQMAQAVIRGEADFGESSTSSSVLTIAKGADLRVIAAVGSFDYLLAATSAITNVQQLNQARVGIFSNSSDTNLCLQLSLRGHSDVKPQLLIGGASSARVEAMLAGQMDASPIQYADWIKLQSSGGSKFHVLENYAEAYPTVMGKGVIATTATLRDKATMVNDYLKANLKAARALKDGGAPAVEAGVKELLPAVSPDAAPAIAKAYSENFGWSLDGGMSAQGQKDTVQALLNTGLLQPADQTKTFFDSAPMERALKEVGA